MRSAAQIDIVIARVVDSDGLVLGEILNDLDLELLVLEHCQRVGLGDLLAAPVFLALEDFLHLGLDLREILGGHGAGKDKVIIEAVGDLRADGVLYVVLAEQFDDGLGKHMRQGMAVDLQEFFSFHGELLRLLGSLLGNDVSGRRVKA